MSEAVAPTQGTAEQPQSTEPTQPVVKNPHSGTKHKVIVDGQEHEVTYEDLLSDYQHKKASYKRFEEANKIRKEVDGLFENFSKGDLSFIKKQVPPDVLRKFAEQELQEYLRVQSMTPEQREAMEAKQERDQLKEKLTLKEKQEQEQYIATIQNETNQQIETEIIDAVKGLGHDVKITPRLVRRIAEQMQISLRASDDPDVQHLPAKIAAERAWRGLERDHEEFLNLVDPEKYIAMLPRKLRDAIRKADVESAMSQTHRSVRNANQLSDSEVTTSRAPKFKRGSTEDWFTRMENTLQKRG
jgi:hypothetical protein